MSQEQLADKLGVPRQAITKWETNIGIPDIENLIAISKLFNMTIDELLFEEQKQTNHLYESTTEYDIDHIKRYDMKLGGANTIILSGYDGAKMRVRLYSNTLSTIQSDLKVKIDDIKNCIDLQVNRFHELSETSLKESLWIEIQLPQKYLSRIEISAYCTNIEFHSLECDDIEFDGKTSHVLLNQVKSQLEFNCNIDMEITCQTIDGSIDINQISSTSKIYLPKNSSFKAVKKGIGNQIIYKKKDEIIETLDNQNADYIIEFNGMNSELIICI